jgi:hypothetical protein
MRQPGKERRSEIRSPATGAVTLSFADPLPVTLSGQLLDISAGGFRAAHGCPAIRTGMSIEFSHAAASGKARVAWNRIAGNTIETGFVLCGTLAAERRAQGARTERAKARLLPAASGARDERKPAAPGGVAR